MGISEGSRAVYCGDDTIVGVGARATLLAYSGSSVHLKWLTGGKAGDVDLVPVDELVPDDENVAHVASTLAYEGISDVVDSYQFGGVEEAYETMSLAGHLATAEAAALEAYEGVIARLRQDRNLSAVMAHMDPEDAEALLGKVASSTIFTEGD